MGWGSVFGGLALAGAAGMASAAHVTIDFEELPLADGKTTLLSRGFVLDASSPLAFGGARDYHLVGPADPFWRASNATQFMVFDYFSHSTLNIHGQSAGVFGLDRLDLAEAAFSAPDCASFPRVYEMLFTGHLAGGGTITRSMNLDMVCDGLGPLADFQTIDFNGQWNRLTRLTIEQLTMRDTPESWIGIDNIRLRSAPGAGPAPASVPEPGTAALAGAALCLLGAVRRRPPR